MNTSSNPWTGGKWKLRTTSKMIESLMISDTPENNVFWLTEAILDGKQLGYRLEFDANKMATCWNGRFLIPRGNTPVPLQISGIDETNKPVLQNAAFAVQGAVNSHRFVTERLECDIVLPASGELGSLSLYQVPGALVSGFRLLVVSFRSDGNPGGTGGGGSDHT